MSAAQGGKFWAGFAAGTLSSIAASFWQGGTDTKAGPRGTRISVKGTGFGGIGAGTGAIGTLAFGAIAGGAGSALGGGNFWQGAVTGLIVAGFNHLMHDGDGSEEPKKDYRKYFRDKLSQSKEIFGNISNYVKRNAYASFRFSFDNLEAVGGYMEILGIAGAFETEGVSLGLEPLGARISGAGTIGNSMMDLGIDNNANMASYRVFKYVITAGTGKVVSNNFSGFDEILLQYHTQFYNNVIIPRIENNYKKSNLNYNLKN